MEFIRGLCAGLSGGGCYSEIRERSRYVYKGLVTNYGEGGGLQNGRVGGQVKFYPYERKGGGGGRQTKFKPC